MRWCCGSCAGANGAARCDGVALVLVQADRVSPARTRTEAESTSGPIVAAVSTDIDGNGCICVEPALCRCGMRYCLRAGSERPARCWCASSRAAAHLLLRRMADPRAQHAPVGRGTEAADVPGMRCCGSCSGANSTTAQPDATEWLWLWCKPIGYRQHGLGRQLSQLQAQSSPLRAPISTEMVVSASSPVLC